MKKHNPKFQTGSLYLCSKCGKGFSNSKPDLADNLKTELRAELKEINKNFEIRVMVGSCVSVCEKDQQTFTYHPNNGEIEIYSSDNSSTKDIKKEILNFLLKKLKI